MSKLSLMSIFLPALSQAGPDTLIQLKVVPGSSRDRVMGMLGDRLKVAVSAPPEDGKANKSVCALLAKLLEVPAKSLEVIAGHTNPRKTIQVTGMTVAQVAEKLG